MIGALSVAFLMMPIILVGTALVIFWRSLTHRWAFGVIGILALLGLHFPIRELVMPITADNFIALRQGTHMVTLVEATFQKSMLFMNLLFIALAIPLLGWLRKAMK